MEHCEGLELFDFICQNSKLKESDAVRIVSEILKTLNYLHSRNIVHRDLKPENVIFDPKAMKIKLIDFGLSSFFTEY